MNKLIIGLSVLGCGLAVGCASQRPERVPAASTVMAPPQIPVRNEANVWLPDEIKAYAIERYRDPTDPNIMHERHVVYRREQQGDWRLQTNANRQILIGNTMGDGDQDLKPALMEQELARELQRQRAYGSITRQNAAYMMDKGAQMNDATLQLMEMAKQLKQELEKRDAENKKLKGDLEIEKAHARRLEASASVDPATGLPRSGF